MEGQGYEVFSLLKRKTRFLGIIDYETLIFIAIYIFVLWNVLGFFTCGVFTKLYILVIFTIPVLILVTTNLNEESVIYMIFSIFKYTFSPKLYVYKVE